MFDNKLWFNTDSLKLVANIPCKDISLKGIMKIFWKGQKLSYNDDDHYSKLMGTMYMPDPVLCARTGIWVHACPDIPFCAFCSSCSSLLKIYFIVYSKVHEKWPCWKKNTSYCSHGAFCVCYSQLYGQTGSCISMKTLVWVINIIGA